MTTTNDFNLEELKEKYKNTGTTGVTFYYDNKKPQCYGYQARFNGKQKRFTNSKYSMNKRLQQAVEYMKFLKENHSTDTNPDPIAKKPPKKMSNEEKDNIDEIREKYKNVGIRGITFYYDIKGHYGFRVLHNKKHKVFARDCFTIEEKLQMAKDYLKEQQKQDNKTEQNDLSNNTIKFVKQVVQFGGVSSSSSNSASNNDEEDDEEDYKKQHDGYEYTDGYTDEEIKFSLNEALKEIKSFKCGEIPLKERMTKVKDYLNMLVIENHLLEQKVIK